MLVVMQSHAAPAQIDKVVQVIQSQGLTAHVMPGATRTAIGITGNTGAVDKSLFDVLPGVEEAIRVTKPYKLASREMKHDDTIISLKQGTIGPKTFTIVAGPCSVESE
ncbi:MAG: 3-deoxy-7-phosphoheptulonate synthase, partial [Planctomycetia bacterium]|nr:3-deoxy-7-phosphoheptulonate synthase [Planctomycetia bacterium]